MSKEISNAHLRKIMISDGSNDIKQLVLYVMLCDDTTTPHHLSKER